MGVIMSAWEILLQLLHPSIRPLHSKGDWNQVEADLERQLPEDFKAFISAYGSGSIGSFLSIVNPFDLPTGQSVKQWVDLVLTPLFRVQRDYGIIFPIPF